MDRKINKFSLSALVMFSLLAASAEPLLVKIGYQRGYSSLSMIFFRNIVAFLVSFLLTRERKWLGWPLVRKIIPLALLLFAVNASVIFALKFTSASSVIILTTTTPLFVALANQWLGRDILQSSFWIGLAASFVGVYLSVGVSGGLPAMQLISFLAMVAAVLCSTTYRVYMETVTKEIFPAQISFYIFGINALLTLLCFPFLTDVISFNSLSIAGWTGIAAVLANIAFISSIHLLGSTRMSIIDMLQRPLVVIGAVFLLNEALTMMQVAGCLLTFFGTQFARVKRVLKTE